MTALLIRKHQAVVKQRNLAGYYLNFYRWAFNWRVQAIPLQ